MCLHIDIKSSFSDLIKKIKGEKTNSPPLTPEDIVGVLNDREWEAEIVKASSMPDLQPVNPNAY